MIDQFLINPFKFLTSSAPGTGTGSLEKNVYMYVYYIYINNWQNAREIESEREEVGYREAHESKQCCIAFNHKISTHLRGLFIMNG